MQAQPAILHKRQWFIEGYGCLDSAWQRFAKADTLVYIDLPLVQHFNWVTKRLVNGLFSNPEGWPKNSPILKSSLRSYRVLWLCHKKLTPKYRRHVSEMADLKAVHHLPSKKDILNFLKRAVETV